MKTILSVLAEIYHAFVEVFTPRLLTPEDCKINVPAWEENKTTAPKVRGEGWRPVSPGSSAMYRPQKTADERMVTWDIANKPSDLSGKETSLTAADAAELERRGIDLNVAAMYKPHFAAGLSADAAVKEMPDGYAMRKVQDLWAAFNAAAGTSKPLPRYRRAAKRQ